jgi:uncharacterized protein YjbI with pentapeptide repeats
MGSDDNQNPQSQLPGTLLRQLDVQELNQILEHHQQWVIARGEGKQMTEGPADLSRADLTGTNLAGADLQHVNFQGACLRAADLRGANLNEVNLSGANLLDAKLQDADLRDANLKEADLLLGKQLAGADVAGAQLPGAILKFEGLQIVEQISRNARTIMFSMLLACVYTWLTIATTTDPLLLTNSSSSPLPIIRTEIPIAGFFWVAPLILLGFFLYFHIYLQRLWETLADLPAVFPDGTRLDNRAYPWLLNGLVTRQFKRLRNRRPQFSRLQTVLSVLLAWWTVPVTLLALWLRYLPRHDWLGTILHIALTIAALGSGFLFYRAAMATLCRELDSSISWNQFMRADGLKRGAVVIAMSVVLLGFTFGAIHGIPHNTDHAVKLSALDLRVWVPRLLEAVGNSPFADFIEDNLSTKPDNWVEKKDDKHNLGLIKGARLKNANLTYVRARSAFLVKADLRQANLYGADLTDADLRQANLAGANLNHADFNGTRLLGVILKGASLKGVNLRGYNFDGDNFQGIDFQDASLQDIRFRSANLQGANLQGAHLKKVDFEGTNLQDVNLNRAKLDDVNLIRANLYGTHLNGIQGLSQQALGKTMNWVFADLDESLLTALELPVEFPGRVRQKNLSGMSLPTVIFFNVDLQMFNFARSNLQGAEFWRINLEKADLSYTDLKKAQFQGDLSGANLSHADLQQAVIKGSNLSQVNLSRSDLRQADISRSNLSHANLQGADFKGARLMELDLSSANLENTNMRDLTFWNWVKIDNANLKGADFSGSHIVNARGLTCQQIQQAIIDQDTELPKYLGSCEQR